jgi:hypothetical protein
MLANKSQAAWSKLSHTIGETQDLVVDTSSSARFKHFFVACGDSAVAHVVHDGIIKKNWTLRNNANTIA